MTPQDQRALAITTVKETIEASIKLREGLVAGEAIGREMIHWLEQNIPISQSVTAAGSDAASQRATTNELIADYTNCRHRMRVAFMLPSLEEGMSISDIADQLGVSRQVVDKLVHEARDGALGGGAAPASDETVTPPGA
jgi:hypothetical protein